MADFSDHGELYTTLGVPPSASHEDIVRAYKTEVRLFEEACNLSKKTDVHKEAEARHRQVSKAFTVLSDASRRRLYDNSGTVSAPPKVTKRTRKQARDYYVNYNEQSLSIYFPSNLAPSWVTQCEEHHSTKAVSKGKDGNNGHHMKTVYSDAQSKEPIGSVSITVYESTNKIHLQGSAYLLWFLEEFPGLKEKVDTACPNDRDVSTQLATPDTRTTIAPATDGPSSCPECDESLVPGVVCATCNTVPKDLLDCNSNTVCPDEEFTEETPRSQVDQATQFTNVTDDYSIVHDNVNKLESCLVESIADRKSSEDSILQKLSVLEGRIKTCEQSHVREEKLVEDIARLDNVKRELVSQVKSLQRKYDELSSAIHKLQTSSFSRGQTVSTETQTTQEASDRADRLLHELANVNVHNRFQALAEHDNDANEIRSVSNTGAKHREETHKPGAKQSSIQNSSKPRPPVSTIRQHQQQQRDAARNKEMPPDLLILGDSNTKTIKTEVLYPSKRVEKELTYNLSQATTFVRSSNIPDPKVILFHVGTNDIRDTADPTVVSENFRKLIQVSHDKYPQASLVFSSVLPRCDRGLQEVGDDVNSFLRVVAEETSYVHVTDNTSLAHMGSPKADMYNSDGYHLNKLGVRVLVSNIKRVVNPILGLGQYASRGARSTQGQLTEPRAPSFSQHPVRVQEQPARSTRHVSSSVQSQGASKTMPSAPAANQPPVQGQSRTSMESAQLAPTGKPQDQGSTRSLGSPTPNSHSPCPWSRPPPSQLQEGPWNRPPPSQLQAGPWSRPPPSQLQTGPWSRPPPSQQTGPWSRPPTSLQTGPWPPMLNHPPAPWGLPPPNNAMRNQPPRVPPPPWPWHPALMWPPMVW